MPERIGLGDQHLAMVGRHDLALGADVGQARIEAAGAQRGDLGELERPEGAAVGDLDVVGDRLVAEHQERMVLEGGAHGLVGLGVGGDVEHGDALHLDAESRSQRNQLHRVPPRGSYVQGILSHGGGRRL